MSEITRTPLCWPNNVARTAPHLRSHPKFGAKSITDSTNFVLEEVNRLNAHRHNYQDPDVIISTNCVLNRRALPYGGQAQPADTGVAVYFQLHFKRNGKAFNRHVVLTCDKWNRVEWNLYAIGMDIEAQRARARWGCTNIEQAFQGYVAIPEKCGGSAWWLVLGVSSAATRDDIEHSYRKLSKTAHPDTGGDRERWLELQTAYNQAMAAFA